MCGCEKPVQNRFAEGKGIDACPVFLAGVERKSEWSPGRHGRPMQACRPFGNITLHGHGL